MSMRFCSVLLVVTGILVLAGCQDKSKEDVSQERLKEMSGGELKETVPVSGKVSVDGTPQKDVTITLYSLSTSGPVTNCTTGENGEYCWSSYLPCDGLPAGEYRVAFEYLKDQKKNDEGTDVFKGKYRNPKGKEFSLTVVAGAPMTNVNYELKTKGK